MKTLGCINGKIHIAVDGKTVQLKLDQGVTAILLTPEESIDLGDVITYAATEQLHMLPDCPTFRKAETGDCSCQ